MSKSLVLYFSVYGTTKAVAEEIARQTGADLVEIEPAESYDGNRAHYNALARKTKREADQNARPKIRNKLDLSGYERIFLGFPMWWYTVPMILHTLFEQYDFSGKTIIPFNTHMGSGDSGVQQTLRQMAPKAKVVKGLAVEMRDAENRAEAVVRDWIKGQKFGKGEVDCA